MLLSQRFDPAHQSSLDPQFDILNCEPRFRRGWAKIIATSRTCHKWSAGGSVVHDGRFGLPDVHARTRCENIATPEVYVIREVVAAKMSNRTPVTHFPSP